MQLPELLWIFASYCPGFMLRVPSGLVFAGNQNGIITAETE